MMYCTERTGRVQSFTFPWRLMSWLTKAAHYTIVTYRTYFHARYDTDWLHFYNNLNHLHIRYQHSSLPSKDGQKSVFHQWLSKQSLTFYTVFCRAFHFYYYEFYNACASNATFYFWQLITSNFVNFGPRSRNSLHKRRSVFVTFYFIFCSEDV